MNMETFRPMRRRRQELPPEEAESIMRNATSGVLAVNGDGGYPYAVPVSFVYAEGRIYFHSAKEGHKLNAITRDSRVSFCIIAEDNVVPEEFTTYFRSVIAFGKAKILTDEGEKMRALRLLTARYADASVTQEATEKEIAKGGDHLVMVEITVEHMTGKEAIELVRKRTGQP